MLNVSAGFLDALASSQLVDVRADVRKGTVPLYYGLPITGGTVTVDRSQVTRRRVSLTLAPRLSTGAYTDRPTLPEALDAPLGHYGQEISVYWSLHYVGGVVETLPLGVFRIDDVSGSLAGDDEVTVSGVSREAFVADAKFVLPRTLSGPSAATLIAQLIHEVLPSAEVVVSATRDARVPATTFDEDRWGAIATLADSMAAVVYCDPYGRFLIADAPTVDTPPVWRVAAGPGGVLVRAAVSSSRADIRNGIVLRGESPASDSPPVQAVVTDDDPTSPTRWGDPAAGRFGMAPEIISVPTVTTLPQARALAVAKLAQRVGAASTLDVTSVPNPALEAGDAIEVVIDPKNPAGTVRRHIVDSFPIPLVAGGDFTMATRDVRAVVSDG